MRFNKYIKASCFILVTIFGLTIGYNGYKFIKSKGNGSKVDTIVMSGRLADFSEEDLSAGSSLIVEGKVSSILPSKWNTIDGKEPANITGDDIIYHDVLVDVNKILKGTLNGDKKSVKVRVFEGEISQSPTIKKVIDNSSPKFIQGEEVLLFLSPDSSNYNRTKANDHYIVSGKYQGKYTIKDEIAKRSDKSLKITDLYEKINKHKNDPVPVYFKGISEEK